MLKFIKHATATLARGVTGTSLLDPIEVFYLPKHNRVFPVNSKSGTSSVKMKIIRQFTPDFQATFPGIHRVDPAIVTSGEVERVIFKTRQNYREFCAGKDLCLVVRNPYDRYHSLYLGVTSGRNVMYKYPSQLDKLFPVSEDTSWSGLINIISRTPDYLSDRHFRSQAFYLSDGVKSVASSVSIYDLPNFIQNIPILPSESESVSDTSKRIHLNDSKSSISEEKLNYLINSKRFQRRYREDLALYKLISGN